MTRGLLILFVACFSCRQAKDQAVIPPEKMQHILLDLHLAESYSLGIGDSVKHRFDRNYDSLAGFYTSILNHYEVDLPQFKKAMTWYQQRPDQMDSLYGLVLNLLNEQKAVYGIKDVDAEATVSADSVQSLPAPPDPSVQEEIKLPVNKKNLNRKDKKAADTVAAP